MPTKKAAASATAKKAAPAKKAAVAKPLKKGNVKPLKPTT